MARSKNDIERYLNGEMTPAEMHALEREALQDPFLSEALEGIDEAGTDSFLYDLKQLHNSVRQRTSLRKPKIISMWNWSLGIAAGLILLALSSVYIISIISNDQRRKELAQQNTSVKPEGKSATDSVEVKQEEAKTKIDPGSVTANDSKHSIATEKKAKPKKDNLSQPEVAAATDSKPTEPEDQNIAELSEKGPEAKEDIVVKDISSAEFAKKAPERAEAKQEVPATRFVTGKVISSEDKSPLPGVNVVIKGTNIGTITDVEGNYQLAVNADQQKLVFSFIGLESLEADANSNKPLNVEMNSDVSQLSEVVVTGYAVSRDADDAESFEFAQPAGGKKAFKKYLEDKMQYPVHAIKNKVEGKVTIEFSVDTDGQLNEFKVLKGIGYGCDDEVIRLVKQGPRWSPSKRNSQPVKDKVRLRFKFDLPGK